MVSIVVAFVLVLLCSLPEVIISFKDSSYLFRLSPWTRFKLNKAKLRTSNPSIEKVNIQSSWKELQVKFNCNEIDSDELGDLMIELGVSGVSVEPLTVNTTLYLEESNWHTLEQQEPWSTALIRAQIPTTYNIELLATIIEKVYGKDKLDMTLIDVEDKDWVKHVQESWSPLTIGNLTILFPWHNESAANIRKYKLHLEGGAAFGTGDHPTTRLCCEWLERNIIKGGMDVLDFGCGSGILGLASLLFGAKSAIGTDLDKTSLISAARNAKTNNLTLNLYAVETVEDQTYETNTTTDNFSTQCQEEVIVRTSVMASSEYTFPSAESIKNNQYDVVVANILAPTLMALAPTLVGHTKDSGTLLLSGILASQADRVIERYFSYFDRVKVTSSEGEWVLIEATNKK